MPPASPRRPASPALLAGAFAAYSLTHLANNTLLQAEAPRAALLALQAWSGGWIEPVLVRSQVVLAVFLAVVVVAGRRRLADVGWRPERLLAGLGTWLGAWCLLQLVLLAGVLARDGAPGLHPMWTRFGLPAVLGGVLAQGLGHALVEDTAFRGFFLPELRAHALRAGSLLALPLVLTLSVVGSALLFGLAHLPTLALVKGAGLLQLASDQAHFFSAGLALGAAYVATRNLFAVVGLHVLLNDPAPLLDVPGAVLNRSVLLVFALVVAAAGVRTLQRAWRRRRAARAQPAGELGRAA
jgi:membrane protease YdiL (CAAX protease family)